VTSDEQRHPVLRVADSIVRTEQSQLTDVRTLARLSGLARAVASGDRSTAIDLITPYLVSQNIERVFVKSAANRATSIAHRRPQT
jgi:hypothetical protein